MRPDPLESPDALLTVHALAAAGEYGKAFALVEQRLASRPEGHKPHAEAKALAAVARAAERTGNPAEARRALERALDLVDWADLHFALGTLLMHEGERDAARAAFDRALAINPRYRAAAVERALLDARDGRIGEAVHALRTLAGGDSSREAEALREGLERLHEAEFEHAAPLVRAAFAGSDDALAARIEEAESRFAAGEVGAGLALLRRAVSERPGYPDLHALLGAHELRAGYLDDGIASLIDALSLHPGLHAARLELARGFEARGERDRALTEVRRVLEVEPSHADAAAEHERLTARRRGTGMARE